MADLYQNSQEFDKWGLFVSMFEDSHANDEDIRTLAELLPTDLNRLILNLGCPTPILEAELENAFVGCSFVAAIHFHFTTMTALERCWRDVYSHLSVDAILSWQWCQSIQHGSIVIAMGEHLEAEQCLEDVMALVEQFLGWSREIGRCLGRGFSCDSCPPPLWSAAERACVELTFWKDAKRWWTRRERNFMMADGMSVLGDRRMLASVYGCNALLQLLPRCDSIYMA
ncbi:hypothetical protein NLG97_g1450 [Lecanicillium saksenae]|uniref:Uncharacterized protein n=1 Tax=Lecanicillium saksenae TaxID=468837 RepID=A0ACC1R3P7_9HYPO|nr:hypothetical protein NLG97_g1450 [Lecanicillium saksenae]